MFIPIGDDQEHERRPIATITLIALNVASFFIFCLPLTPRVLSIGAFTPDDPRPLALLTSMFLHVDLLHLGGNMLFLWIFGRLAEERFGRIGFPLFYLASGLAAQALHSATVGAASAHLPVLGASGAVSGAVGATLIFCPRAHIKVFVWLFWWGIYEMPAVVWIGLWIAEQVYFSSRDYGQIGHIAYFAHFGGFAAGAALAWLRQLVATRLHVRRGPPLEPKDSAAMVEPRRPFRDVPEAPAPVFLDDSVDRYAVVTLDDQAALAPRISEIAGGSTRIDRTHGVVVRAVPRAQAERIRRELNQAGIPSALIADVPANYPPPPERVESVTWDDRLLRFRLGNQSVPVPWSAPLLFVAASLPEETWVDVLVRGKSAYRVRKHPEVSITRVDVQRRSEATTDLGGFACDILQARPSSANEGARLLAQGKDLGWLAFKSPADYDDYLFWTYNLALSKAPIPEI